MASIEAVHEQYEDAQKGWQMVKDCVAGARRVKERGIEYLPKLKDQTDSEYEKYKKRGIFFNATATANNAQSGLLTRKQPEMETELSDETIADIDLQGNSLTTYLSQTAQTVTSTGRGATIVDWSEEENRPYFSFYVEEDILDWHTTRMNGANILDYLKVRQRSDEMADDGFSTTTSDQIRIFRLNSDGLVVEKYERQSGDESSTLILTETIEPKRKGQRLNFIPVAFHNVDDTKPDVGEIPLEDIASINISHYNTSVDLEHARHIAALPTPWATGISSNAEFRLGSEVAWVAEDTNAKFGFLEFTGAGLSELTKALEEKEKQMAALGARLLFAESRDAEAFETVQLRASADTANLTRMASAMSVSISNALQIARWWEISSTAEKPSDLAEKNFLVLSNDFISAAMPAERLTALVSALQMNAISYETFFYNLQKGEMYQEGRTLEEEVAGVEDQPLPTPTDPGTPPDDEV